MVKQKIISLQICPLVWPVDRYVHVSFLLPLLPHTHVYVYMLIYFPIQIKTGAPCRSERLAKYNQVRIAFVTAVAILFIIFQFKSGQLKWYVLVTTIGSLATKSVP